jgi:DNA polymerase elongation subunit (family B)
MISPQVGLHENVVVLDYENEYSNLILRHNLVTNLFSNKRKRTGQQYRTSPSLGFVRNFAFSIAFSKPYVFDL